MTSFVLKDIGISKATNFAGLFQHCQALKSLYLFMFNTKEAVNLSRMFSDCNKLETLRIYLETEK